MIDDTIKRLAKSAQEWRGTTFGADLAALLAEVDRLRTELAEASKDAVRYCWLRGDSCMDHSARWTQWEVRRWDAPIWTNDLRRADLDAAIDAAMRKEPDHAR